MTEERFRDTMLYSHNRLGYELPMHVIDLIMDASFQLEGFLCVEGEIEADCELRKVDIDVTINEQRYWAYTQMIPKEATAID